MTSKIDVPVSAHWSAVVNLTDLTVVLRGGWTDDARTRKCVGDSIGSPFKVMQRKIQLGGKVKHTRHFWRYLWMMKHPTARIVVCKDIKRTAKEIMAPLCESRLDRKSFLLVCRPFLLENSQLLGENAIG